MDQQHRFLKKLGKLGFAVSDHEVEHPGRKFCRFIFFKAQGGAREYACLEFIHTKPGGSLIRKPGLSFGFAGGLEDFHRKLKKKGRYKSKFFHKNYEWKKDSVSRLPGWNMLTFPGLGLSSLFPWMTEFEPRPGVKPAKREVGHANGCKFIHGFVLELDRKGEAFFSHLLGKKLQARTRMRCGTMLYVSRAKKTRLKAVVLKCKSVPRFVKKYGGDGEGEFFGKPAARIANPVRGMWDLLLV